MLYNEILSEMDGGVRKVTLSFFPAVTATGKSVMRGCLFVMLLSQKLDNIHLN